MSGMSSGDEPGCDETGALAGRYCVVTGANRGIGEAIVRRFARAGGYVALCVRTPGDDVRALVDSLPNRQHHTIVPLDLSQSASVEAAAKAITTWSKSIDVLVNNAGVAAGGTLAMTKLDSLRAVFEVNVFGTLHFTQKISRAMLRKKSGAIVTIGSTAGLVADPGNTAYGASKAAVMHAARVLAGELAPFGIRSNAIAPGVTEADMLAEMDEKAKDALMARAAIPCPADPNDIAQTALFLASDGAKHITGQVIRVDGGLPA